MQLVVALSCTINSFLMSTIWENLVWNLTFCLVNSPYAKQGIKPVFWTTFATRGEVWRNGESARLPPRWPGFNSRRRRHMWVEFVVGSFPCSERFFSGYSGFPLACVQTITKL